MNVEGSFRLFGTVFVLLLVSACSGELNDKAYDAAANESVQSDVLTQTTPGATEEDNEAPTAASDLSANNVTSTSITLSWNASTDNVAVTGYRIFRNSTEIATSTTNSYQDQGLTANAQYQYTVTAYDAAANESSVSTALNVSTSAVLSGACGLQAGTAVAINFDFVTPKNIGKYVTLAATSNDVEYSIHDTNDAPNINWSKRYKVYKYGDGGAAITQWLLDSGPTNGVLYESTTELAQGDSINDPDDLFYVPDSGFTGTDSFAYCVADSTGQSNVATVSIRVAETASYPMPIGINDPGFGIDETPPADPVSWPSTETIGYYYIDSDDTSCSDDNDYGYPDVPRCSIPHDATIVAGGKMILASSVRPYTLRNGGWHRVNFDGAQGNPAWLVGDEKGPDKPRIVRHSSRDSEQLRVTGSNLRISGVVFDGALLRHMDGGDNIVLRHMELKNIPATTGSSVGLSTGGNDVLVFNVYSHDNGVVEAAGLTEERDVHAFVGSNQSGFWLLDIRCDENAGDCVQLTNNNTTSDVFVGRMVVHSEGENCVDIKDFNRVVVSESSCWDLRMVIYGDSGGNSQSFYVNDEGAQQNYVYFLNNRSWDSGGSNFGASNIGGRVYFIGNVSFASPAGDGLSFTNGSGSRYAYFNTLSDSKIGIYHYGSGSSLDRYVAGNLVNGVSLYQARLQSDTSVINTLDYNFYTDTLGRFASGGSTPIEYVGLAAFQASLGYSKNSQQGVDAVFVDEDLYDFSLNNGSSIIDSIPAGVISGQPLLLDLANDLGITLRDIAGTSRPQGGDYEPGAFSYKAE